MYEVDASYQGQDVETIKVTYEVLNEITKVEISKQDITTGKNLPGAHMVIKEKMVQSLTVGYLQMNLISSKD